VAGIAFDRGVFKSEVDADVLISATIRVRVRDDEPSLLSLRREREGERDESVELYAGNGVEDG